jgi:hypothetical protein
MGLIAKTSKSTGYTPVPAGVYVARCYMVLDLGTQSTVGKYGAKNEHKLRIGWEILDCDETGTPLTIQIDGESKPMTIGKNYTVSLHEKAVLRKDLSSWRGVAFTDEEANGFDVSRLINAYCMLNITTSESDGATYSNITSISPLPGALKNKKPAAVHKNVVFNLDEPDMSVFESLSDYFKEKIMLSPEWHALKGSPFAKQATTDDLDCDIAF